MVILEENRKTVEKLKQYFIEVGFEVEDVEKILHSFQLKEFEKETYFVEEGKISRHLAFVESGVFQYFVLKEGEERTTYISIANTFMGSLLSYLNETPAREYIRALTAGKLWVISKDEITKLQNEIPAFKAFNIGLLEWQICCIEKSRFDLITLTAEQRYEKILAEEPHLLQHIPLQYLASVLGITPRHLSRIRKNIR